MILETSFPKLWIWIEHEDFENGIMECDPIINVNL